MLIATFFGLMSDWVGGWVLIGAGILLILQTAFRSIQAPRPPAGSETSPNRMRNRLLLGGILAIGLGVGDVIKSRSSHSVTVGDDLFQVDLPAEAKFSTSTEPSSFGEVQIKVWVCDLPDGQRAYVLRCMDYPAGSAFGDRQAALRSQSSRITKSSDWGLISQTDSTWHGYGAVRCSLSMPQGKVGRALFALVGTRLYILMGVGGSSDTTAADALFDSVRLRAGVGK